MDYNRAVKAIHEFNLCDGLIQQVITHPILVPVYNFRWTQPANDFFKLNVDAAGPNEDGKWDAEGVVVAAAGGMAILKGIELAKDLSYLLKLNVESDSSNVIAAINDSQQKYLTLEFPYMQIKLLIS